MKLPRLNKGEVLVLRTCDKNMTSHGGFKWPKSGAVKCKDWSPEKQCGNGLHGLLWGEGDSSLLNHAKNAVWQVVAVSEKSIVDISQKVKFPCGRVVLTGTRDEATALIVTVKPDAKCVFSSRSSSGDYSTSSSSGNYSTSSSSGDYSASSSSGNYSKSSSSGDYSTSSSSGDYSASSSSGNYSTSSSSGYGSKSSSSGYGSMSSSSGYGSKSSSSGYGSASSSSGNYSKSSSSGDYSTSSSSGNYSTSSSSGDYSASSSSGYGSKSSSSGDYSTSSSSGYGSMSSQGKGKKGIAAVIGLNGKAMADEIGCLILCWWDTKSERIRVSSAYVGEDGIEANTWYKLDEKGRFVKA